MRCPQQPHRLMPTAAPHAGQRHRTGSLRRIWLAVHVCRAWCLLSFGGRHSLARTGTCQLIDQPHSGRATPTRHQVVATDRVEAAAVTRRGWVAATGDVVEYAGVTRADAEVVERGIDEPHSALSVRHGLLIDQGQKTCPAWRGKARAAVAGHETAI